ncbi:unnamed protein product, partial [Dovyalis caffra]
PHLRRGGRRGEQLINSLTSTRKSHAFKVKEYESSYIQLLKEGIRNRNQVILANCEDTSDKSISVSLSTNTHERGQFSIIFNLVSIEKLFDKI